MRARLLFLAMFLPGVIGASVLMFSAWEHNPGGRFHAAGVIHWVEWLKVGIAGFVFTGGLPIIIAATLLLIQHLQTRRR